MGRSFFFCVSSGALLGGGCGTFFSVATVGRKPEFGIGMFILAEVPRIDPNPSLVVWMVFLILAGSLFFGTSVFRVVPLRVPDRRDLLGTDGLYSVV